MMYADLTKTHTYDDVLAQKASTFQNAQSDAAWLGQMLALPMDRLGSWLVNCGQWLQTLAAGEQVAMRKLH